VLLAIAALAWAAGLIHAVAGVDHFREYWLFGLFFALLAPAQVVWGGGVYRSPRRRLLIAGGALNVAVALLWVVSRTVGLPLGPETWRPEPVGAIDLLASCDEAALAALVALVVWPPSSLALRRRRVRAALSLGVYALLVASVLAAMLGGHRHAL
jgi:hypothetical protein